MLVDVDGVISLFGFDHTSPPPGFPVAVDGTPHWLSEGAGARLMRLARTFECVWCTGWEERAEEHLPDVHWKLASIDSHAGPDRTLAWVDDDHDARW